VLELFGRLDIAFNNAGILGRLPFGLPVVNKALRYPLTAGETTVELINAGGGRTRFMQCDASCRRSATAACAPAAAKPMVDIVTRRGDRRRASRNPRRSGDPKG
jgi:hypothetical protein